MEKGLQQSHGINYAEYEYSLEKKLKVERERELDYEKCKKIANQLDK
ncbi:hypothetical protein [Alkalihalobacillus trypoxylicola]|nr:hypothetical protein [Alkalihalobacillus trypoxylicola]